LQGRTLTSMRSSSFILICILAFMMMLSHGTATPILPIYAKSLGAPIWLVGVTVSSFFVFRAIFEIPAGAMYAKVGWRTPILLSMATQGAAAAAAFFTSDIRVLITARMVSGIGTAVFFLTAFSFIASSSPRGSHGRFIGTFQGIEYLGQIVGSMAAGLVAEKIEPRAVFLFSALIVALGAAVAVPLCRGEQVQLDTRGARNSNNIAKAPMWTILKMPPVYVASTVILVSSFAYQGMVSTVLPLYVNLELAQSLIFLGFLSMCMSVGQTAAMFLGGPLADRIGYRRVLALMIALSAIAMPLFSQFRSMEQLVALSLILGVAGGLTFTVSIALIGSEVVSEHIASGIAIYRTVMDLGGLAGPFVMATMTDSYGYGMGFTFAGATLAIPWLLLAKNSIARPRSSVERER